MDIFKATEEAITELQEKGMKQIQVETAAKWCGRARAARILGLSERDITEFAHEAVEHAALSGDEQVLRIVRIALEEFEIET